MDIDIAALPDDELLVLYKAVSQEYSDRALPREIAELAEQYRIAKGLRDGTKYVPPTGAHNAIPAGESRVFEGNLWENTSGVPLAFSPTEYPAGWTDKGEAVEPEPVDPGDYLEWEPDVAYSKDPDPAIVSFEGIVYTLVQPHTSQIGWEPAGNAALWTPVED